VNIRETLTDNCANAVPLDHQPGTIYFVTCDHDDFPIKIGFATNVKSRMIGFQTALPYPVILLAQTDGTRRLERKLHRQFKELRLRGEWFKRDPLVLEAIEDIKSGKPLLWRPELDPWSDPAFEAHIRALRARNDML
jgi:hypothetical protein